MINSVSKGKVIVKAGDLIVREQTKCSSVNIIVSGRVELYLSTLENTAGIADKKLLADSFLVDSLGGNQLLGFEGLYANNRYLYTAKATTECILYVFQVADPNLIGEILQKNRAITAFLAQSFFSICLNINELLLLVQKAISEAKTQAYNLGAYFYWLKRNNPINRNPETEIFRNYKEHLKQLEDADIDLSQAFTPDFISTKHIPMLEESTAISSLSQANKELFLTGASMDAQKQKTIFGQEPLFTYHLVKDFIEAYLILVADLKGILQEYKEVFGFIYNESEESLFTEYTKACGESQKENFYPSIATVCRYLYALIKDFYNSSIKNYKHKLELTPSFLNTMMKVAISSANGSNSTSKVVKEVMPHEFKGSLDKILTYVEFDPEARKLAHLQLNNFLETPDKENCPPKLSQGLSELFFRIYRLAIRRMLIRKDADFIVRMFINFGFLDERLLNVSHLISLKGLVGKIDRHNPKTKKFSIYYPEQWLACIYNRDEDPSFNDFGESYREVFREHKKQRLVTDDDEEDFFTNKDRLLDYELANMWTSIHKLCSGKISTYCPVLHRGLIIKEISNAFLTYESIEKAINKIVSIDFSAFYREVLYKNHDEGIDQEPVMMEVRPNFIISPIFGRGGMVWQPLASLKKDSPGRIALPIMNSENINDVILTLIGNFRWELCKSMSGSSWNDLSLPSLTSYYADYIMFYKKNRDLTEEARDKLTMTIKKYRNSMRDIFTSEYKLWIVYESRGSMRLNKVARGVFYQNCPLELSLRTEMNKHPLFIGYIKAFEIRRMRVVKSITGKYNRWKKTPQGLPPALVHNMDFYTKM